MLLIERDGHRPSISAGSNRIDMTVRATSARPIIVPTRAEDGFQTSEARNQLLGDSAPFGIIVVEPEGHVAGANQRMLNMLDWPSDRDVTELDVLHHPPLVESGVADSFRRCLEKKTRIVGDHSCLLTADGR